LEKHAPSLNEGPTAIRPAIRNERPYGLLQKKAYDSTNLVEAGESRAQAFQRQANASQVVEAEPTGSSTNHFSTKRGLDKCETAPEGASEDSGLILSSVWENSMEKQPARWEEGKISLKRDAHCVLVTSTLH